MATAGSLVAQDSSIRDAYECSMWCHETVQTEFSLNVGLGVMSYEEAAEEAWDLYNSCVEGQC